MANPDDRRGIWSRFAISSTPGGETAGEVRMVRKGPRRQTLRIWQLATMLFRPSVRKCITLMFTDVAVELLGW